MHRRPPRLLQSFASTSQVRRLLLIQNRDVLVLVPTGMYAVEEVEFNCKDDILLSTNFITHTQSTSTEVCIAHPSKDLLVHNPSHVVRTNQMFPIR